MNKIPLDIYDFDLMPRSKKIYIMQNGNHFNKELYEYAASLMFKINKQTGKKEKIPAYTKEDVDTILKRHNIEIENKGLYDYVYVAQSIRADYLGGSITDEIKMAIHIKEVCDDPDKPDSYTFKSWCLRMDMLGEPIDWEEYI